MKELFVERYVVITPRMVCDNGVQLPIAPAEGKSLLDTLYRSLGLSYPKFHKMDGMSKLGFLASEMLLGSQREIVPDDSTAVVVLSRHGSHDADTRYAATIADAGNYFPSPAVFVYTLPNIVTGEIAIRNRFYGETSSYIVAPEHRVTKMLEIAEDTFADTETQRAIVAWTDYRDSDTFGCLMLLVSQHPSPMPLSADTLENLNLKL